jgi:sec-independent protein translocase protein TatA
MGLPSIGPLELIIVLAIALLIVGPGRLPEMGNAVGRTIREFRKASTDMTDATKLDPEAEAAKDVSNSTSVATEATPAATATPAASTVSADESAPSEPSSTDVAEEIKPDQAEQA